MLDTNLLRSDLDNVAAKLLIKKFKFDKELFLSLEEKRKALQIKMEELQAKRNATSKQIGILKSKGEDVASVMGEVAGLGDELKSTETEFNQVADTLNAYLATVPNLPDDSVPEGVDESANVEVRRVGVPRDFDFLVKDHVDIGVALDRGIDFEAGAKVASSRFAFLKGQIAKKDNKYNLILSSGRNKFPKLFEQVKEEYKIYTSQYSSKEMAASLELSNFLLAYCIEFKPLQVVDLGSGFSSFVLRLYKKSFPELSISVYSVDDNSEWLEITKKYLDKNNLDLENILLLNDLLISNKKNQFDLVLLDLNFIEIRKKYIQFSLELINKTGTVIIDDVHKIEFLREVKKITSHSNAKITNIKSSTKDSFGRFSMLVKYEH